MDQGLLLGLLAVQNELISEGALLDAVRDWISDPSKSLEQCVVHSGNLEVHEREGLAKLVSIYIKEHIDERSSEAIVDSLPISSSLKSALELAFSGNESLKSSAGWFSRASFAATEEFAVSSRGPSSHLSPPASDNEGSRFSIVRQHARGGLGVVYVATDRQLRREVALKQIRTDKKNEHVYRQKFMQEAQITGNLEHPGIVPVYAFGTDANGNPYYAMRFIQGESLEDRIKHLHSALKQNSVEYLGPEFRDLLRRFIDVCNAISYAHENGVLHRDLKPGNVMLGRFGETLVVDWGLAKSLDVASSMNQLPEKEQFGLGQSKNVDSETRYGAFLGTASYAPPEQLRGELEKMSPKSDVFSLGAILFELTSGMRPVSSTRSIDEILSQITKNQLSGPIAIHNGVPPELDAICKKAMSIDIADRYESVTALRDEVQRWLDDLPVEAHPDGPLRKMARWTRRHRAISSSISVGLFATAVAGLLLFYAARAREISERTLRIDTQNANTLAEERRIESEKRTIEAEQKRFEAVAALDRASRAENESDLLKEVVDSVIASPSYEENPFSVSYLTILGLAKRAVESKYANQPTRLAALLIPIAASFERIGQDQEALSTYSRASEVLMSHDNTAPLLHQLTFDRNRCYLNLLEKGDLHPSNRMTGDQLNQQLNDSLTVAKFVYPENTAPFITVKIEVGRAQRLTGAAAKSLSTLKQCALELEKLSDVDKTVLRYLRIQLALSTQKNGEFKKAIELLEQQAAEDKSEVGAEHRRTLIIGELIADTHADMSEIETAVQEYESLLKVMRPKFGLDCPDVERLTRKLDKVGGNRGLAGLKTYPKAIDLRHQLESLIEKEIRKLPSGWNGDRKLNATVIVGRIIAPGLHSSNIVASATMLEDGYFIKAHRLGEPFIIVAKGFEPRKIDVTKDPVPIWDVGEITLTPLSEESGITWELTFADESGKKVENVAAYAYITPVDSAGASASLPLRKTKEGTVLIQNCPRYPVLLKIADPRFVNKSLVLDPTKLPESERTLKKVVEVEHPLELELEYVVAVNGKFDGPSLESKVLGGNRFCSVPKIENFFDFSFLQNRGDHRLEFFYRPSYHTDLGVGELKDFRDVSPQIANRQISLPFEVGHVYLIRSDYQKRSILVRIKSLQPRLEIPHPSTDEAIAENTKLLRQNLVKKTPLQHGFKTVVEDANTVYVDLVGLMKDAQVLSLKNSELSGFMLETVAPEGPVESIEFVNCIFGQLRTYKFTDAVTGRVSTTKNGQDSTVFMPLKSLRRLEFQRCKGLLPEFLIRFQGCESLTSLSLNGTPATPDLTKVVSGYKNLRQLNWMSANLDPELLEPINQLQSLDEIALAFNDRINGKVGIVLSKLSNLKTVDLGYTGIRKGHLQELSNLKQVKSLGINNCGLTVSDLSWIGQLENIEQLNVSGNNLDDEIVPVLMDMTRLKRLYIYHTKLSDQGFKKLLQSQQLTLISIGGTGVSREAIDEAKKLQPTLNIIEK